MRIPEDSALDTASWEICVGTVQQIGNTLVEDRPTEAMRRTFEPLGKPIPGRYDNISTCVVQWDGRAVNTYISDPLDGELWRWEDFEKYRTYVEEKKSLGPGFKIEELDKVILPEATRKSIVSVLKQHQHSKKIFQEWGLGEVIEYGKGMTMLFFGPPGTGKTWAAVCIARAMGKQIKIVDSAQVQSSEPGGMERALQAIFAEAKKKKEVLFIDECDSMIQSRDGMGQIMSAENNCLLKEIENFEGMLILATNRVNELDSALERRISLVLEFPEPDEEGRRLIWKRFLPEKMPLGKGVTPDVLAKYVLTGGFIKNAVLGAARLAVSDDSATVNIDHFKGAIEHIESSNKAFAQRSKKLHGFFDGKGKSGGSIGKTRTRSVDMSITEAEDVLNEVAPMPAEKAPAKSSKK